MAGKTASKIPYLYKYKSYQNHGLFGRLQASSIVISRDEHGQTNTLTKVTLNLFYVRNTTDEDDSSQEVAKKKTDGVLVS